MQLFNYLRVVGAFTDANQLISIPTEPKGRQERRMLDNANELISRSWSRRLTRLNQIAKANGEEIDEKAEEEAFKPKVLDDQILMPLQYIQDYLVRRIAGVQTNASIHSTDQVEDLMEVFSEYEVKLYNSFENLTYQRIAWTASGRQKPKVLLHATQGEEANPLCIRFEAAAELAQKYLMAAQALSMTKGRLFSLEVKAEDPAEQRNKRAGKKVIEEGKYVNHNLLLTVEGNSHTGHPPKGERFNQKPTMEFMESLFHRAVWASEQVSA